MPPKKSVEDLDAELAALEAELAALESGAPPPPKKAKKAKAAPPPEPDPGASEAEPPKAPKKRFGLPLPRRAGAETATPEETPADAAPAAPPKKRFGFSLPKRATREEPESEPFPPVAPEPAEEKRPEAPAPSPAEPAPPPAREGPPPLPWQHAPGGWRVHPRGPTKVEVVRRSLDAEGRIVGEEQVGEEFEAPPKPEPAAPAPEAPRRFGLFRTAAAPAEPAAGGDVPEVPPAGEPPARRRRTVPILAVLLVAGLLLVAIVLPAVGVDPLGLGRQTGLGGGSPPVATFTASASVAALNTPVTFDATGSVRAEEYNWDFGDGEGTTTRGPEVTHPYAARGEYTVTLTVRDAQGRTATDRTDLRIVAPPVARMALSLGGSPLIGDNSPVAGEELTFSGGGSTADGGITAYAWEFGDGARATGAEATHAFASPGAYRAVLTVTDANALRNSTSVPVYVGLRNVTAGEIPASLQAAQVLNLTLDAPAGSGALPFQPMRLRAVLNYTAPGPGAPLPVPVPDPGGVNQLTVTLYDPSGVAAATASGPGAEAVAGGTELAPGTWTISLSRPQGGAQPITYSLEVELLNGPA